MNSDYLAQLRKLFEKLPGIGPRQASRFIWALLDFAPEERKNLSELIGALDKNLARCAECFRAGKTSFCSFCAKGGSRDRSKIMVVEKDSDLVNIEKSKIYGGLYHVLGGALDPLEDSASAARERVKALYKRAESAKPKEIILALSPTKLGEFTASYITKILEPLKIKTTRLARGLATGTDLEYADEATLRQALDNRK
ncbi:MAG: recombination protein RecR [Candidatus Giovannonibacteria bacterium]|nr:MAG: recombination protein RecR [Candidatus Giovannonibacteria bacterium]